MRCAAVYSHFRETCWRQLRLAIVSVENERLRVEGATAVAPAVMGATTSSWRQVGLWECLSVVLCLHHLAPFFCCRILLLSAHALRVCVSIPSIEANAAGRCVACKS